MGSDNSKPAKAHKPPSDTDPVGTHIFTASFPATGDYAAFVNHLNLPLIGAALHTPPFKPGDRVHLEATQTNLQNFGQRLFSAFQRASTSNSPSNEQQNNVISKDTYVKLMKMLYGASYAPRLDFLLDLYTTPADPDHLDYNSVLSLFKEMVSLYHHLHTKEEAQISEFGYCIVEDPAEVVESKEVPQDTFVSLKDNKKDAASTSSRPSKPAAPKEEEDEVETTQFPQPARTATFETNFVVPKHKTEDVLPTEADMEAQLMKEVQELRATERAKSAKIETLTIHILNSIISSAFKDAGVDITSSLSNPETLATHKIEVLNLRTWILRNMGKAADILQSIVKLNVSARLEANANELVKKQYQRVAPMPDGVSMEKSSLWCPAIIWTMHQCFTLKGIGSFKLLYSSAVHGRSLNRYVHHVVGYKSETMFIITTTTGEIFGAFVSTPWESNSSYWSNSNCYLFGISPVLAMRHSISHGPANYAYFFTNKKSFSGKPVGIGFGGVPGNFRLWIDEDLLSGTVRTMDPSFETGAIASNPAFDIASIEVWGSCTDFAEAGLLRERRLREKDAERARKAVDKGQAWNESADKFIMDLAGKTGHSDGILEAIQRERREAKEREERLAAAAAKLDELEMNKSSH